MALSFFEILCKLLIEYIIDVFLPDSLYEADLISTIVDHLQIANKDKLYEADLISTIVDMSIVHMPSALYATDLISTIVDARRRSVPITSLYD